MPEPEHPLCRSRQSEDEVYRFWLDTAFDGDALVQVGRKGEAITLRCQPYWQPAFNVGLTRADWDRLQEALNAASFWSLNGNWEMPGGFDGARWLIEGRRGKTYRAVHHWCPDGPVHDLGRLFLALAGAPLADIDLQ